MDPTGKVALITGAARRVGRAIALELAEAGFDIAVHYRTSAEAARELAGQIEHIGRQAALISGDLADLQTSAGIVNQTRQIFGRLDVLVNNASVFIETPISQMDTSAWEQVFRVNVIAPAMLARAATPIMRAAGGGCIINLADIYAERPIRNYGAYCASKAALVNLTKSLAIELAPEITVNAVAPGIALFPDSYDPATRAKLISRVPLARAGTPGEVAALVRFLVTTAEYITGQIITIDGGRSIGS